MASLALFSLLISASAARGSLRIIPETAAPAVTGNPARRAVTTLFEAMRVRDFWLLAGSFFVCGASTNGLIGTHMVAAAFDCGIPEVRAAGLLAGGDAVRVHAGGQGVKLLLLAGRPIGEPVVQYGPFVMNTPREIEQAIIDYQRGTLASPS